VEMVEQVVVDQQEEHQMLVVNLTGVVIPGQLILVVAVVVVCKQVDLQVVKLLQVLAVVV